MLLLRREITKHLASIHVTPRHGENKLFVCILENININISAFRLVLLEIFEQCLELMHLVVDRANPSNHPPRNPISSYSIILISLPAPPPPLLIFRVSTMIPFFFGDSASESHSRGSGAPFALHKISIKRNPRRPFRLTTPRSFLLWMQPCNGDYLSPSFRHHATSLLEVSSNY